MLTERRRFLKASLAASLLPFSSVALASVATEKRLVVIIQRGAQDGLHALPPYADPAYASSRPRIAISQPGTEGGALKLDGLFGLHPALTTLHSLYRDEELLALPAIATRYRARSHFDAQNLLENGSGQPFGASTGWLNRALQGLQGKNSARGVNVGLSAPLILQGPADIDVFAPNIQEGPSEELIRRLMLAYEGDPWLSDALMTAASSTDDMEVTRSDARNLSRGRDLPFMAATIGRLLAQADGPRVAVLESNGWDTHDQILPRGQRLFAGLNEAAGALKKELGTAWADTAVVTISEFGRTARENGSQGSDHGSGGTSFLFGGAVRGGQIVGSWPGMREADLFEGRDLYPENATEALLKATLITHLGVPENHVESSVFPGTSNIAPLDRLFRG